MSFESHHTPIPISSTLGLACCSRMWLTNTLFLSSPSFFPRRPLPLTVMRNILEQAQSDPRALQDHMKSPLIREKIQKLQAAGVIRMR